MFFLGLLDSLANNPPVSEQPSTATKLDDKLHLNPHSFQYPAVHNSPPDTGQHTARQGKELLALTHPIVPTTHVTLIDLHEALLTCDPVTQNTRNPTANIDDATLRLQLSQVDWLDSSVFWTLPGVLNLPAHV